RLGDNTSVNFEKSAIFLTSNLGARDMMKEINPDFGFQAGVKRERVDLTDKLQHIALSAVRKRFSPEFVNRIDAVITYQPLDATSLTAILEQQIFNLQKHVNSRLGQRQFQIEISDESRQHLLKLGTSSEYGARELNRTIHRQLMQPLAAMVAGGQVEPGCRVRVEYDSKSEQLSMKASETGEVVKTAMPTVLIVDDNGDLIRFLERLMVQSGWKLVSAGSIEQAQTRVAGERPDAALLDYHLPDGNGVDLAVKLRRRIPGIPVMIMSGLNLPRQDEVTCEENDFRILRKPFLANEIMAQIRKHLVPAEAFEARDVAV
ncbi:MAG: response regulator, partial [Bryobacteraceae bacterium]